MEDAIAHETKAIEAWAGIVEAAGDVYSPDLMMGVRSAEYKGIKNHLSGHWKDELGYLNEDLVELEAERDALTNSGEERRSPVYREANPLEYRDLFQIEHQPVRTSPAGEDIKVSAHISAPAGIKWVRLRYRSVNQKLDYLSMPMSADSGGELYQAVVPAQQIDKRFDFMYFIEVMDKNGNGRIYPDFEVETPYIIVELER